MTEEQSKLIDSIIAEFNRISIQETKKKKFNLIDAKALTDEKKEREYWEKISEDNKDGWRRAARQEARRIMDLLKEDLPSANINVPDHGTRIDIHHKDNSSIRVIAIFVNVRDNPFSDPFKRAVYCGTGFEYAYNTSDDARNTKKCATIESILNDKEVIALIRDKVL
jgi:hypothetical protein